MKDTLPRLVDAIQSLFPGSHVIMATKLVSCAAQYTRIFSHEHFFYIIGAILILLVSFTRIYLGDHYSTDIVAGF